MGSASAQGRRPGRTGKIAVATLFAAGTALSTIASAETLPPPRPKPAHAALTALVEHTLSNPSAGPSPIAAGYVWTTAREVGTTREVMAGDRYPPGPQPKPEGLSPVEFLDARQFTTARRALDAAFDDEFGRAFALADETGDRLTRELVEWIYLRSTGSGATAEQITAFLARHPDWPQPGVLRARAEAWLYDNEDSPQATVDYFRRYGPSTGEGMVALASAYRALGQHDDAARWFTRAWREQELGESLEKVVRERCQCITDTLDRERLARMSYRGAREETMRAGRRLGGAYLAMAEAMVAVDRRSRSANTEYGQVPESHRNDPALMLSRISWLRRAGKDEEAQALLLRAPTDIETILDAEAWWTERRLVARRALAERSAIANAYKIASSHALTGGGSYADAEFLSGWIALRHLGDAAAALRHFDRLRASVDTPISVARAEYWLARANDALGRESAARDHRTAAARHGITFYGQLARAELHGGEAPLDLPSLGTEQWEAGRSIDDHPLMQASRLLAAADHRINASRFLRHLSYRTSEPGALQRIAHMANVMAMPQIAVRVGKTGVSAGAPVHDVAYPTDDFPILAPAPGVEHALLLALTRQESEFAWQASSHAGARGLMQVMPATGKMLARRTGVPFSLARLGQDPSYNASLGASYLAGLVEDFDGSYVLAIASYNAGPGRVGEWIGMFGDPRDANVDVIDWIETIPFNETRNYVQRVMENLQVYRARLAAGAAPIRISADLARGRSGSRADISLD